MADDRTAEPPFPTVWKEARPAVEAYCRRNTPSRADADDLVQIVAIRAWLGYATFRGDSSFRTWVLRIAAREAARHGQRTLARLRREVALDEHGHDRAPAAPDDPPGRADLEIVRCARRAGDITDAECRVVLARLAAPTAGWAELAAGLGAEAGTCAVAHCRAVPKIRVHAFVHHRDSLGGVAAIRDAFATASARPRPGAALTDAQAEVFTAVVLAGRTDFRRRGWQTALRAACAAVAGHLAVPGPPATGNAPAAVGSTPVRA